MKIQEKPDYLIFADSAKNGECANFPDISRGWGITIEQTGSKPPLEWMNGAFNRVDKNMLYLLQQGVPEWNESVKYPVSAIIKYNGVLYTAIAENDNSNPAASTTKWKKTIAEVPTASTEQKGAVKLSSATDSTSETEAATSLAVKKAFDVANEAVKKSGDTMTGQLILSKNGLKINYDNKNIMALITSDDNYSHVFYDAEKKQWQNKLIYNSTTNTWGFQYVDDVTINNKSLLNNYIPVGVPLAWPTNKPPAGWFECNGSAFNKNQFKKLAAAYPSGKLPDLRGEFIRGWDNTRGIDIGRSLLSNQSGSLAIADTDPNGVDVCGLRYVEHAANQNRIRELGFDTVHVDDYPDAQGVWGRALTVNAVKDSLGLFGVVRPRNVAFMYIVKAE